MESFQNAFMPTSRARTAQLPRRGRADAANRARTAERRWPKLQPWPRENPGGCEGEFLRTVTDAVLQLLMEADVQSLIGGRAL